MAESTLSLTYDTLSEEIAEFLGYTRTSGNWSASQAANILSCLKSGLRQFYQQADWEWSFLKPVTTMVLWADVAVAATVTVTATFATPTSTITASAATFYPSMVGASIVITDIGTFTITGYTSATVVTSTSGDATCSGKTFSITANGVMGLPDDCQDIEGEMTFEPDEAWVPVVQRPEDWLRRLRQTHSSSSGPPQYFGLRPRTYAPATGQRWDIMVWPDPDDDYTMTYRKCINLDALATTQYPPGGMAHSETILESCLAVAEARYGDTQGLHKAIYEEWLVKSKAKDARLVAPESLGRAIDPGVRRRMDGRVRGDVYVTYKDVLYPT